MVATTQGRDDLDIQLIGRLFLSTGATCDESHKRTALRSWHYTDMRGYHDLDVVDVQAVVPGLQSGPFVALIAYGAFWKEQPPDQPDVKVIAPLCRRHHHHPCQRPKRMPSW